MKKVLALVVLFVATMTATAQEKKLDKNKATTVLVNGNCGMCKKRIETAAYDVKGVKKANWDANTKKLELVFDENKSSQETIEKAIAEVGHDTPQATATEEAYNKLHGCCQYDRNQ